MRGDNVSHSQGARALSRLGAVIAAAIVLVCALCSTSAEAFAQAHTKRFALVVGANDGGRDRVTLRYAVKDAREFSEVLESLGGVERARLLVDPDQDALEAELDAITGQIKRAQKKGHRAELIFYYSGHSNEEGLLLGEELYPYKTLKTMLDGVPVEVRVVILDSCSSGTLTRLKGGRRVPAFLSDESTQVSGHAILTSAAADEAAQESDRVKGSFFTHYLISGLRGAADMTGDRRVTLTEAYQFAFRETLERTENTLGGAQHPAYDIQLSGHGDLVLTEYSSGTALLQLSRQMQGRLFVREESGDLVAELYKQPGRQVEIGLPPATYEVHIALKNHAGRASVDLRDRETTRVSEGMFETIALENAIARGDLSAEFSRTRKRKTALGIDLFPWVGSSSVWPEGRRNVSLNLLGGVHGGLYGFELGGITNLVFGPVRGLQLALGANGVSGSVRGAQLAAAANVTTRGVRGAQLAGVNIARDDILGLQAGGINLTTGALKGAQLGGLNMQLGLTTSTGLQCCGVNIGRKFRGTQLGALNLRLDESAGVLQLGAVNVANRPVQGFMFGVVNVAPRARGSFGLINVFWDGALELTSWANSEAGVQVGMRHGTGSTYNIYSVGLQGLASQATTARTGQRLDARALSLGILYGGRKMFGEARRVGAQFDVGTQWMLASPDDLTALNILNKARIAVYLNLGDRFGLYAGPSYNVGVFSSRDTHLIAPPGAWTSAADRRIGVSGWPGFFVGADFR